MGGVALPTAQAQPALLAQERQFRVLTVTGQGVQKLQTTLTQVRLGVEVQGKTAQEVQEEVARRSSAVVTLLKSRQVDKLETTGINLNPDYNYDNGKQQLIGYRGSNSVTFQTPTEKAGPIMDLAVKSGASQIDGISFLAEDAAIATAQKQALVKATQDAQAQAQAVLSALNLTPQDVVSIQINGANTPPPPPVPYPTAAQGLKTEADNTPVIGGEQSVPASVTLQIRY
ncbi:MAG: SIMPL domain-containing protein [Acaryochloridaceae cyanobacterium SU_2_1]|nr:SIMPL domain-containing protein [Acaryochloridaceae cyanobacterium SU_2_1]